MDEIRRLLNRLEKYKFQDMYNNDFFFTWDKTMDELMSVFTAADILRKMRENNISPRIFDSGLGISKRKNPRSRTAKPSARRRT